MKISYNTTIFNRLWQLKKTISLNFDKVKYDSDVEFILVNFNGEDNQRITDFVVKNFSRELITGRLKYYVRNEPWDEFHVALAKNRACRFADGDIFVTLDCDNLLQENDSSIIRNVFKKNDDSNNLILHQSNGTSALYSRYFVDRYNLFPEDVIDFSKENTVYDGTFGRISIHRTMFQKLNGYNENLLGMGMEDIDLLIRGIKLGGLYVYKPSPENCWEKRYIPQPNQEEEHNNNQVNWKIMDKFLERGEYSPYYEIKETDDLYQRILPST